jgi:hypothetical protein
VLLLLKEDTSVKNLARWAALSAAFLDHLGVHAFEGFVECGDLLQEEACLAIAKAATNTGDLFYRPIRGFGHIAPLPTLPNQISSSLFYNFN